MSRFELEPDLFLRPYVHCYWGLARDLSTVGGFTVTPDRFLELIVFLDPPWVETANEQKQPLPACVLIPLLNQPLRLLTSGMVRCAAVRLHAWAAAVILPPPSASSRQWHDASLKLGNHLPRIRAALRRNAWKEIAAIFNAALVQVLTGRLPAPSALAKAQRFMASPESERTRSTRDEAARQHCSRRQVERQVRSLTRRSPKQLSSLSRFQYVRDTLWARPDVELAVLAFEAGYADQAHMTRHFRRYAMQTPGEFIQDSARLKAFVRAQDVAFLQDG